MGKSQPLLVSRENGKYLDTFYIDTYLLDSDIPEEEYFIELELFYEQLYEPRELLVDNEKIECQIDSLFGTYTIGKYIDERFILLAESDDNGNIFFAMDYNPDSDLDYVKVYRAFVKHLIEKDMFIIRYSTGSNLTGAIVTIDKLNDFKFKTYGS